MATSSASIITNRYKDIDISFTRNPITGDIYTLTDIDAVKRAIKLLVLTQFGERLFHPEIGSSVYSSLFENLTVSTKIAISRSISDVINNFEPRASLLNVDIQEDSLDVNNLIVTVSYYIVNTQNPVTLTINLERIR
jgi:phage baseplate assembly protein W